MDDPRQGALENQGQPLPHGYEPPRVERMLTQADLEREVLYAGPPATDPG
jgi:hypothetical protein